MRNDIWLGNCLELMSNIAGASIDLILCDLPYTQTQNKWDIAIPFDQLWEQYNRISKITTPIILFGNGMFTAKLMASNTKMWKYNWVWNKVLASGHLNAKKMPMRQHEDICVFYKKQPIYNPQMIQGESSHSVGKAKGITQEIHSRNTNYNSFVKVETTGTLKYPKSILTFPKPHPSTTIHPTQKPVALLEYIINTYTNELDLVLDNCSGSGSTLKAAKNTNRQFIGIEQNKEYYDKSLIFLNQF